MAMLNKGKLVYHGSPAKLIEETRGYAWQINADDYELEKIKESYPVITTIRAKNNWEVQVVTKSIDTYVGKQIEPNLEHAYVNYLENVVGEKWIEN